MTHQTPMPSDKNSGDASLAETSSVTPQRPSANAQSGSSTDSSAGGARVGSASAGSGADADTTQVMPVQKGAEQSSGAASQGAGKKSAQGAAKNSAQKPAQKPATVGSGKNPRSGQQAQKPRQAATGAAAQGQASSGALVDVDRAITHVDPISALKMGLVFNLVLFAVWFVAMALIYIVLGSAGVWDRLNSLVADLTGSDGMTAGLYFGAVVALGLVEVVIFTLLAPVVALIYNSAAALFGGVRVTLDR